MVPLRNPILLGSVGRAGFELNPEIGKSGLERVVDELRPAVTPQEFNAVPGDVENALGILQKTISSFRFVLEEIHSLEFAEDVFEQNVVPSTPNRWCLKRANEIRYNTVADRIVDSGALGKGEFVHLAEFATVTTFVESHSTWSYEHPPHTNSGSHALNGSPIDVAETFMPHVECCLGSGSREGQNRRR